MNAEAKRQPVIFGKGGRTITLENGYKVSRVKGGKYSYRRFTGSTPASLAKAMAGEPSDIVADVRAAADRLNLSAQIETRRQQGR